MNDIKNLLEAGIPHAPQDASWFVRKVMNRLPDADPERLTLAERIIYVCSVLAMIVYVGATAFSFATSHVISMGQLCGLACVMLLSFALVANVAASRPMTV